MEKAVIHIYGQGSPTYIWTRYPYIYMNKVAVDIYIDKVVQHVYIYIKYVYIYISTPSTRKGSHAESKASHGRK